MPRYDNHVRARASLARKVAQRRYEDGFNPVARADVRWALGCMPTVEDLLPAAYTALAAYEWPEGWGTKYSRFRIGGRPMYVDGQTQGVPARIIRKIVGCMPALPKYTAGARKRAPASIVAPVLETSDVTEDGFDFDKEVEEVRARLERLRFASTNADDSLLATPADDDSIERLRRESLDAYDRVEQAEADLEKALREQKLFGRGAAA